MDILKSSEDYIKAYGLDISPEELFIQFEFIIECHKDFNMYLKDNGLNEILEKMKRSKRLLEKRKLFTNWYIQKYQNNKMLKELHLDLSEIVFASERTVREDIISLETTAYQR
ncbi:hypothetical protein [Aestuariibaculum marinum]|uniref:Uncharacterized protein n=1 Tax=Aestuariibaculum marinum TaxID=2683592 RepID=A0A8J6Q0J9_9FLAO|nr:hypothetical protein [Aestuariibaculum marinum]MBD0822633.1 hypothetical protein [Aestuariibaculum marinum]